MCLSRYAKKCSGYASLPLRLALGSVFIYHGFGKLFPPGAIEGTGSFFASVGIPSFLAEPIGVLEFVGGLFLVAGLLTRYVALLLAADMAVAIALVTLPQGFAGSEFELTLLLAALSLVLLGSQKFSVDSDVLRKEF
ncbi:DoxX family protein [Candidatus Woesearchaeota archaeon]|nr:DoxX family protein [Candidatus Woesearchaeota archaeon]